MRKDYQIKDSELRILREEILKTSEKWPQYNLLIDDLLHLSSLTNSNTRVLIMERNLLYGGVSIFSPFFRKTNLSLCELTPEELKVRGGYNADLVSNIDKEIDSSIQYEKLFTSFEEMAGYKFDLIVVPNLVHHIADQRDFFYSIHKLLSDNGQLYVFEALLREIHQYPIDFIRYTPQGLSDQLKRCDFVDPQIKEIGSPFEAVAYCLQICKEFIPQVDSDFNHSLFSQDTIDYLREIEDKYPKNLVRKNMSFPQAFSVLSSVN